MEVPTTPAANPFNFPLPDPQWVSKKMRPNALGDRKHSPGIDWVLRKRLDKEMKEAQEARALAALQAETIISDDGKVPKAVGVDPAFPDNAILIIDDKKETQ